MYSVARSNRETAITSKRPPGQAPVTPPTQKKRWLSQIGWMFALWLASISALAIISLLLKLLMHAAGFNT